MAQEFRYSLTRICLRSGELSLSNRMAAAFPGEGTITAYDTLAGKELQLTVAGPRRIAGVAEFFSRHDLRVNDTIIIRRRDDGVYSLTAVSRSERRGDRAAVPDRAQGSNPRKTPEPAPRQMPERGPGPTVAPGVPGALQELEAGTRRTPQPGTERAPLAGTERTAQPAPQANQHPAAGPTRESPSEPQKRARDPRDPAVTPYPRGVLFPGAAGLNSRGPQVDLGLVNRAREALQRRGFRVEGLAHGMLLARAELVRRQYAVLVRVLGAGERLDWAALLASRRERRADYLAVFGDHRDLHRLSAPADLARATLWAWDGLARVESLASGIAVGPLDLEPHFESGGMLDEGLERFESHVRARVTERGVLSAVIARLAGLPAPSVFLLDDLVDAETPRDQVARMLELLGETPLYLVERIDRGEYHLRQPVDEGLTQLSEYALSLRRSKVADRGSTAVGGERPNAATGESTASGAEPAPAERR